MKVALRNRTALALIFVWGWLLGPAVGYLITWALPLEEPYAIALLLASLAPLLIKGLTIDSLALAKPLVLTILIPLIVGTAFRCYKDTLATRIFPAAKLSTLLIIVWCLLIYGRDMLNTAGSLVLLSMTLFMVGMALGDGDT